MSGLVLSGYRTSRWLHWVVVLGGRGEGEYKVVGVLRFLYLIILLHWNITAVFSTE